MKLIPIIVAIAVLVGFVAIIVALLRSMLWLAVPLDILASLGGCHD